MHDKKKSCGEILCLGFRHVSIYTSVFFHKSHAFWFNIELEKGTYSNYKTHKQEMWKSALHKGVENIFGTAQGGDIFGTVQGGGKHVLNCTIGPPPLLYN